MNTAENNIINTVENKNDLFRRAVMDVSKGVRSKKFSGGDKLNFYIFNFAGIIYNHFFSEYYKCKGAVVSLAPPCGRP